MLHFLWLLHGHIIVVIIVVVIIVVIIIVVIIIVVIIIVVVIIVVIIVVVIIVITLLTDIFWTADSSFPTEEHCDGVKAWPRPSKDELWPSKLELLTPEVVEQMLFCIAEEVVHWNELIINCLINIHEVTV